MTSKQSPSHVFLVCYPGQGHINPTLRLAKKLAADGLLVTISTAAFYRQTLQKAGSIRGGGDQPTSVGNGFIRFEFFEDGLGEINLKDINLDRVVAQLELSGRPSLTDLIKNQTAKNRPVSCLILNPFLPWTYEVAEELQIPCAILWVQSCAVFSIYYHYFHNFSSFPSEIEPKVDVQLPILPLLKNDEIPSFLHPNNIYGILGKTLSTQIGKLSIPFCILMDTFEELEKEIINYMSKTIPIKPIGPLFLNSQKLETEISVDCLKPEDCMEWLNSKPPQSVVYVSFGSIVYLKQEQIDEIAYGLCNSGFSFLWVLKPPSEFFDLKRHILPAEVLEKTGERGKIVQWSSQERVLSHESVGCFLTHCGWNSSVEAVANGVPVVAFPHWGDQVTNAKFLVEDHGVGVRLSRGAEASELITRDEIERCLTEVMISGGGERKLRQNALKWKKAAAAAVADGGSSARNFEEFVDEIRQRCSRGEL
ncbi:limonoid UDP-glucosyltransferase-like [Benincasa hispida]|uniref:limonoid UDP-glucosyltransferase-like n=1 Tax=Benincasa hispida TaxID=102211 RepID=UPI001902B1AA|nr:limonoid UDP-glucosyltransferase-like [Benincasa hispida]